MEENNKAINIFDFDGTLTTESWPKFWVWVKKFGFNGEERNDNLEAALSEYRKHNSGTALETFFGFFNDLLVNNSETITIDELMEGEKFIKYNPGIEEFLKNCKSKNYIVSGGLKDFLQGLEIAKYFEGISGTSVIKNENGLITGIGKVTTDDKKMDAIYKILKDNNRINNDCTNIYYIGDGYSDAPAMKFIHNNGGKAIFVHQASTDDAYYEYNQNIYEMLKKEGIVDYKCVADYSEGTVLSNILHRKNQF